MLSLPLSRPVRTAVAAGLLAALVLLPGRSFADATVDWVQPTRGVAVAVDSVDNVYTVDYESNLGSEIILTKRSSAGALLWQASYDQTDSTKWEKATWVATDLDDNVLVSGTLMSGYSNPVNAASILMKFSSSGALLWRRVFESGFDGSYTRKCLVDDDDNVYVVGVGSGPAGFVSKVKKFAPDGTALWSWFDPVGVGAPLNAKLTPDGAILIVGRGTTGSLNGFAKLDLAGSTLWTYPAGYSLTIGDAAGDALGNTYLAHAGGVRKLGPSGALLWERTAPLAAMRVEVGSDGRPVVSGYPSNNSFGAAFLKLDETGNTLWSNLDADGPSLSLLMHAQMLLDASNNAYLAAGTLFEMAVCKVNADGSTAWTKTTSGSYANAIALGNTAASVFVVGGTTARIRDGQAAGSPPVAVASAKSTRGEAPFAVTFLSTGSYDPDGGTLGYAWDFGDGTGAAGAEPTHTYATPGSFTATLTVTDAEGLVGRASVPITVLPKALRTTAVTLSGVRSGSTVTVTGRVTVRDTPNALVPGARVAVTWTLPNRLTRSATIDTNASGVATFSVRAGRGTYRLTVTGVTKSGYTFDAAGSVLTATITK